MTSIELNASVIRDITTFMGDESAMRKLRAFISTLKRERKNENKSAKLLQKEAIKADLTEALQELHDAKQGKTRLRNAEDLINEL